mmetsp:Transcript_77311/g.202888  ORF Transcript_77311/g.202888 Transcript_77311/m.202888 type:complete len:224 (+) Transcript_77311:904-1575(+)
MHHHLLVRGLHPVPARHTQADAAGGRGPGLRRGRGGGRGRNERLVRCLPHGRRDRAHRGVLRAPRRRDRARRGALRRERELHRHHSPPLRRERLRTRQRDPVRHPGPTRSVHRHRRRLLHADRPLRRAAHRHHRVDAGPADELSLRRHEHCGHDHERARGTDARDRWALELAQRLHALHRVPLLRGAVLVHAAEDVVDGRRGITTSSAAGAVLVVTYMPPETS